MAELSALKSENSKLRGGYATMQSENNKLKTGYANLAANLFETDAALSDALENLSVMERKMEQVEVCVNNSLIHQSHCLSFSCSILT